MKCHPNNFTATNLSVWLSPKEYFRWTISISANGLVRILFMYVCLLTVIKLQTLTNKV